MSKIETLDAHTLAFNALCILEVLEMEEGSYPRFEQYREANGIAETRDRIIELARASELVWDSARDFGFDAPYDFEFVPLFLRYCTNAGDLEPGVNDTLKITYTETSETIELLGQLLAMEEQADARARLVRQALGEVREKGRTVWTPEKIANTHA
jgi:hypothetical protein